MTVFVADWNKNPGSVRPLSFEYDHLRRSSLRNFIEIDHMDDPVYEWPWVLSLDPERDRVAV